MRCFVGAAVVALPLVVVALLLVFGAVAMKGNSSALVCATCVGTFQLKDWRPFVGPLWIYCLELTRQP